MDNRRILSREVQASLIPAGDAVTLPVGTQIDITHRLGGNFTVVCEYGMFRINGRDADAIGEEIPDAASGSDSPRESGGDAGTTERPSEETIWNQLKTVYDPEIPVNIVDLGLVYSMDIRELELAEVGGDTTQNESRGFHVDVKMTLTAPGCGMGPVIAEDARTRIEALPGILSATVDIVWDPPWDQSMISEDGKMELGLI